MTALRAAAALILAAAVGGALAAWREARERGAPPAAPSRRPGTPAALPAAVTPLALPGPLPPLPAGLLARVAGARALEREPCPEGPGGGAALEARCAEPRQAVEIHWHVSHEP